MSAHNETSSRQSRRSRPLSVWLYLLGAVSLGLSALYGGAALMLDRTDDPLGMPLEWLEDTPFRDYFVPGLTLFSVFGAGSFVTIAGVLRRRPWAWAAAVGLGAAQVGWILAQIAFLHTIHWLHLAYGGLGAGLAALALRPSFRAYLRGDDGDGA